MEMDGALTADDLRGDGALSSFSHLYGERTDGLGMVQNDFEDLTFRDFSDLPGSRVVTYSGNISMKLRISIIFSSNVNCSLLMWHIM